MNKADTLILSSAYFPPINYFKAMASSDTILLEFCESFIRQTYRNRCKILATDGVLSLSIPVTKEFPNTPIKDVKIDYSKPWLQQHKRAIISAYRSSPFFEYYQDEIFEILDSGETSLFMMNLRIINKMIELLGLNKSITLTEEFVAKYGEGTMDLRSLIQPKRVSPLLPDFLKESKPYYQVFSDKQGFKSNLSIIDLLFNEGPNSISYLV